MLRRHFLRSALAAGTPLLAQRSKNIEEGDPRNAKLCHRLDAAAVSDDDLRFLEQIGLKWVRLEFGEGEITLDALRAQQRRFAQFVMRIYSGVHYAYRSRRVQLPAANAVRRRRGTGPCPAAGRRQRNIARGNSGLRCVHARNAAEGQ